VALAQVAIRAFLDEEVLEMLAEREGGLSPFP
jgi:hypothetical protein